MTTHFANAYLTIKHLQAEAQKSAVPLPVTRWLTDAGYMLNASLLDLMVGEGLLTSRTAAGTYGHTRYSITEKGLKADPSAYVHLDVELAHGEAIYEYNRRESEKRLLRQGEPATYIADPEEAFNHAQVELSCRMLAVQQEINHLNEQLAYIEERAEANADGWNDHTMATFQKVRTRLRSELDAAEAQRKHLWSMRRY